LWSNINIRLLTILGETNIMKLHFQEFGSGRPIFLLHAFPLSNWMWDEQITPLINKDWRIILPDFPGFGKSLVEKEVSRMEDLATDLSDLFSELNIEQAVIGGLSMGGYAALNFARLFPEKVSALILADTSAAEDSKEKRESRFSLVEKVREKDVEILIDEMLPNVISAHTKNTNKELVADLENEFKKASKDGVIASLLGMAERKDHTEFLGQIDVPTLLIFGAEDKITNLDPAKTLNSKIENSTLITIPDAGHYSNLEQPDLFNKAIVDFLGKLN
jgi:3-oxoadipate enol-lactonase